MTLYNPALAGELSHPIVTSLVGSLGEHRCLLCAQQHEVGHTSRRPRKAPTVRWLPIPRIRTDSPRYTVSSLDLSRGIHLILPSSLFSSTPINCSDKSASTYVLSQAFTKHLDFWFWEQTREEFWEKASSLFGTDKAEHRQHIRKAGHIICFRYHKSNPDRETSRRKFKALRRVLRIRRTTSWRCTI